LYTLVTKQTVSILMYNVAMLIYSTHEDKINDMFKFLKKMNHSCMNGSNSMMVALSVKFE